MQPTKDPWLKRYVDAQEKIRQLEEELRNRDGFFDQERRELQTRNATLIQAVQEGVQDQLLIDSNVALKAELDKAQTELARTQALLKQETDRLEQALGKCEDDLEATQDLLEEAVSPDSLHAFVRSLGVAPPEIDLPLIACPSRYTQDLELAAAAYRTELGPEQ